MGHTLRTGVSKEPQNGGIVSYRRATVRERLFRLLFGGKQRLTILVPGGNVRSLSIIGEGGTTYGQDERTGHRDA